MAVGPEVPTVSAIADIAADYGNGLSAENLVSFQSFGKESLPAASAALESHEDWESM